MPQPEPVFPPDVPVPATYGEAVRALVNKDFLASQRWQKQQWRAVRQGGHPDLLEFERLFVQRLRKRGVPVFAENMVRTAAEQAELYAEGVTKAKAGQSAHNYGMGVDIVHSVRLWNLSKREWAVLGHVGKELAKSKGFKIDWGGDWWDFYDPAHWQIAGWRGLTGKFPFPPGGGG